MAEQNDARQRSDTLAFNDGDSSSPKPVPVYHLPCETVLTLLQVNPRQGLSDEQIIRHRELYGSNALPVESGKPWWKILWANTFNIITVILLACFIITIVFKHWIDAAAVMCIIILNTLIGFISEMRSASALAALQAMSKGESTVIRNGALLSIPIDDVVVGDILALRDGDRVGADARVIEHLRVSESILTGESDEVEKSPEILPYTSHDNEQKTSKLLENVTPTQDKDGNTIEQPKLKIPIGERKNMIFRESIVTSNTGLAVVTAVGFDTKIGQLNKKLQSSVDESTDFEKRINRFLLAIFGIALVLVFVIIAIDKFSFSGPVLIYSSATAIALLPESILLVTTLISAIAMKSLADKNAIVRKLNVLSTLGTITWICSDKTGTLTTNSMQVQRIYPWIKANNNISDNKQCNLIAVGGGSLTDDHLFFDMPDGFIPLPNDETPHESTYINNRLDYRAVAKQCKYVAMVSAMCNQTLLQYDTDVTIDINQKGNNNNNNNSNNNNNDDLGGRKLTGTGNATELALAVASYKLGLPLDSWENEGWYRCGIYPFDSKVKCMSVGVRRPIEIINPKTNEKTQSYEAYALVKGACEIIVNKSINLTEAEKVDILNKVDHLASQSYRVLGLAIKNLSGQVFHHVDENVYHFHFNQETGQVDMSSPHNDLFVLDNIDGHRLQDIDRKIIEDQLTFVGFVAIEDPIKESSYEVVSTCKEAGIICTMLTGDNPKVAAAISRRLGILEPYHSTDDYVITGPVWDSLTVEQIDSLPIMPRVIARCSPESKLTYVEALQRRKNIVSMNGDGVNDSVSIRQANVGAAMGSGTELTKAASDIVIADDNLSTLINAIAEGRHIQQSIKKFIVQLLTGNSSEVTVLLFGLLFVDSQNQRVFPLSPLEILALNMITSSLIAIALSVENIDPKIMTYKPETSNFLTPEVLIDTAFYGSVVSALSFLSYYAMIFWFHDNTTQGFPVSFKCNYAHNYNNCRVIWHARSTVYATMTILLLVQGYICRSSTESIFRMKFFSNKTMLGCILGGAALLLPFFYIPWIANNMFQHAPITWEWGIVGICLVAQLICSEIYKFFKRIFFSRRRAASTSSSSTTTNGTELVTLIPPEESISSPTINTPQQQQHELIQHSSPAGYTQMNENDTQSTTEQPSPNNYQDDDSTLDGLGSSIVAQTNTPKNHVA